MSLIGLTIGSSHLASGESEYMRIKYSTCIHLKWMMIGFMMTHIYEYPPYGNFIRKTYDDYSVLFWIPYFQTKPCGSVRVTYVYIYVYLCIEND